MIKIIKTTIAALVCVLASINGWTQIQGVVRDSLSSDPVSGVHLVVAGKLMGAVTDERGHFLIPSSAYGQPMKVSAVGYSTKTVHVADSLEIRLSPSSMVLGNGVTVTAQRYHRNQFDVKEASTVVDSRALDRSAYRTVPDALVNAPGVWVQKTNHGGGSPVIRGLMGNQVLLMVDGIRMNNSVYRYGPNQYLNTVDPGSVDQIEAIRGAGSVLYGSDAMGGVVQVITKAPDFTSATEFTAVAEGKLTTAGMEKSARAEVGASGNRAAFLGSFSHRDFGDLVAGGDIGTLAPSGYNQTAGDARLIFRTSPNSVLTTSYQGVVQHNVDRYDQVAQGGYSTYYFEPQQRQLGFVRWEGNLPSRMVSSIRSTVALNGFKEGLQSQKANAVQRKKQMDEVFTKSLAIEVRSNPRSNWSFLSGIEYYHDDVSSSAKVEDMETGAEAEVRGSYADNSTSASVAVFTSHEITLKRFSIQSGLRYNQINVAVEDPVFGDQEINPDAFVANAALSYVIKRSHQVILGYNSGFRAPNIDDMSKFGPVESGVFEIPSAGLSPEQSQTFELSFRTATPRFTGSIAGFYTSLNDLIDRVPVLWMGESEVEGRKVYQKQNVGRAQITGFEVEGEFLLMKSLIWYGNATYTFGENQSKSEPMRRIPPLFGRMGVRYETPSGFFVRGEWSAAGVQDRLSAGDLSDSRISVRLVDGVMPAWNIISVYSGFEYKGCKLTVAFRNLLDKEYRVYGSGVDGEGRHVSIMLRLAIHSHRRL